MASSMNHTGRMEEQLRMETMATDGRTDGGARGGVAGMAGNAGAAASKAAGKVADTLRSLGSGERNVHEMERLASGLGGAVLALYGLKRGGGAGVVLGLLGAALVQRGVTGHCQVYKALDITTSEDHGLEKQHGRAAVLDASHAIKVDEAVTIDRPRSELFRYWRNFENLPRIMRYLDRVTVLDERRSRWVANAPGGRTLEWEAEIHNEVADSVIGWRSVKDAAVPNAGSVNFRDAAGGRGTEVRVVFEYMPRGGTDGDGVVRLFEGEPATQVREDLRRFKAAMEGGAAD